MRTFFHRLRFLILLAALLNAAPLVPGQEPEPGRHVRIHLKNGTEGTFWLVAKSETELTVDVSGMNTKIPRSDIEWFREAGQGTAASSTPSTGPAEDAVPSTSPEHPPAPRSMNEYENAAVSRIRENVGVGTYDACSQAIYEADRYIESTPSLAGLLAPHLGEAFKAAHDDLWNSIAGTETSAAACEEIEKKIDWLTQAIQSPKSHVREALGSESKSILSKITALRAFCYGTWLDRKIHTKSPVAEAEAEQKRVLGMVERLPDPLPPTTEDERRSAAEVYYNKARLWAFAGPSFFSNATNALTRAENLNVSVEAIRALRNEIQNGTIAIYFKKEPVPLQPTTYAPTPVPAETPSPTTKKFLTEAQGLYEDFVKPFIPAGLDDNGRLIAFAIVFIGLFWVLPYALISVQARRGNILASISRPKVLRFGLLAYAAFLLRRTPSARSGKAGGSGEGPSSVGGEMVLKKPGFLSGLFSRRERGYRGKGSRLAGMTCYACGKPTDVASLYGATLRFDECPHCHSEIEPVIVFEDYLADLVERIAEIASKPRKKKRASENLLSSNTMTALLNGIYILAMRRRATDIHIERTEEGATVQFRVDGVLSVALKVPPSVALAFLSAIKVEAVLDITNHTTPQDGRFDLTIEGVEIDMRVNCAPTSDMGEILFIRLLDQRRIMIQPDVLGFEGKNLANFNESVRKPHGLILVTGPTGSGKSTTLYVAMTQINTGERNIVTIEDPVEYQVSGLKQMQVNPDKDFTFATGLRSILRQDPDVILVGEIRDTETANMAIDAAATGHLVLTTLHTMDTATAVSRLADLGVSAKRYSSALEIIIAQRLVRLICKSCKEPVSPADTELERLGILKLRSSIKFMIGRGCLVCNGSGYYDRRALLEILKPDADLRALMENETRAHVIRDSARRKGMRILREEGILKIAAGLTTVEEVLRTTR
ncbi:type II/IV secretion system protein [Candidatus Sumerlaeota bacterium]|nr:type II/IV secretion system protein [Candidatus Sumerlaeota bacterium]